MQQMDRLFILIFCWISICWVVADCLPRCLDTQFPCDPHPRSSVPEPNEFAEYITIVRTPTGRPVCTYLDPSIRKNFEIIRPIDNLNQPNFLLLQSPNFGPGQNYRNRRLVTYNVQCQRGRLPFLVFNNISIQPPECFGLCEDFITITPNCTNFGERVVGCGSSTSCGMRPEIDAFNLNSERFTVTFRTSARDGYPGFQLSVTCFEPEPLDDGRGSEVREKRNAPLPVNITLTPLEEQIIRNLTAEFFELIPRCETNDVAATSRPIKTSALHLSLAFENSSNPVIRTAVESTVSIAEHQDPARVAEERTRIRDKCGRNNGDCEQNCFETTFSVQCSCLPGYALETDERSCYEINECLVNNGGCEQICTNTPGSRQCSCRPGFVLDANGRTCTVGLSVSITVDYTRPADFFPDTNEYRAASGPVAVTCIATGPGTGAVSYQWSSTCRNCPFRTATSSFIRRAAVHSGDNGTHTCVATKGGSTARASIDFLIVDAGIQIFRGSPRGNFPPDNGLVISDNPSGNNFRFRIFCRSDSMTGNVGQFIGLDGNSALVSNSFFAIDRPQPGELVIQSRVPTQNALTSSQQGVYTCRIPLQSGAIRNFNIGVYPSGFNTPPSVVDLSPQYSASSSNLTCTTTGSPATTVTWTLDNQPLTIDGRTYDMMQTVINRPASTYSNILVINRPMASIMGSTVTCTVANALGSDTSNSLQISENLSCDRPTVMGTIISITCNPDFTVSTVTCTLDQTPLPSCDFPLQIDTSTLSSGTHVVVITSSSIITGGQGNAQVVTIFIQVPDRDTNECLTNNGGCEHICTNTQGSRVCSCRSGYQASGTRCIDTNECLTNNGGCEHICTNTQGSRVCSCRSGYQASGTRCIDTNECLTNNGGCEHTCTNTQGSRVCRCRPGYQASGTRCIDIDECLITFNGGCPQTLVCINTPGSFECSCRPGFRNISGLCFDINECNTNNGGCAHICTNTIGSRRCSCRSGFRLSGNGRSCLPVGPIGPPGPQPG